MDVDSVLIFDLVGPMAHFRKFDTNSSSLSYLFPPRTTVAGIIAGILGLEKDSYYDIFHPDRCNIGISVRIPPRKLMQTVNYMFVKSSSHLNNSEGHTQIPVEFLLPEVTSKVQLHTEKLRFRVYFRHENQSLHQEVKERVMNSEYVYPPYLGLTEMLAQLEWLAEVSPGEWKEQLPGETISIHSVCRLDKLEERSLEVNFDRAVIFYKERMCRYFLPNRIIAETADYLYEKSGVIKAKPTEPVVTLTYHDRQENILYM
jgi:CRISPR-associated protein Cas5h